MESTVFLHALALLIQSLIRFLHNVRKMMQNVRKYLKQFCNIVSELYFEMTSDVKMQVSIIPSVIIEH